MEQLHSVLENAAFKLSAGEQVIDWLAVELARIYDSCKLDGQETSFRAFCNAHPLQKIILDDPYSRRAFEKPRGYAGDAVMLDYIYRPSSTLLSGIAAAIHSATTGLPNAQSIKWRQAYLAALIKTCGVGSDVLSIACGHMRELDLIEAGCECNFVALDQDSESLAEVAKSYPHFRLELVKSSFAAVIKGRFKGKSFDVIYSAGLFDYLPDPIATALIRSAYRHLKPGGVLSVGNFTKDSHGRGFMEGFMNWSLLYRDEDEMVALAETACPAARRNVFRDDLGNVVYVELFA